MTISVTIPIDLVYGQLYRTSGYLGAKAPDAVEGAFERVAIIDDDRLLLDRFFHEARDRLCLSLRRNIVSEEVADGEFSLVLDLSEAFDTTLAPSLTSGIFDFIVSFMAAKWLEITDKSKSEDFASAAAEALDTVSRKIYCKRRPARPKFNH